METTTHVPMKPVLVERVSDDILDLRKGDVPNQKTLFSARAIQDLVKYDLIEFDNEYDKKYYTDAEDETADHFIDLNTVVDAACRSFPANSYINGPTAVTNGGFVYVLRVLPGGALTWIDTTHGNQNIDLDKNQGTYPREGKLVRDEDGNITGESEDPSIKFLRQFFFQVGDPVEGDNETYVRSATWNPTNHCWDWSEWSTVSGRKTRILVCTPEQAALIAAPAGGGASALAKDVIYELHVPVGKIVLPNPMYYRPTTTITIEQYPDYSKDNPELRSTLIGYFDTTTREYNYITATPSLDRNCANKDAVYDDGMAPAMYQFEVVHLSPDEMAEGVTALDNNQENMKGWELVVDAEETDYLAGMAEMLDSHTDTVLQDIVQYSNRKYVVDGIPERDPAGQPYSTTQPNDEVLTFNRAVTFCGYVKVLLCKMISTVDSDWRFVLKRVDTNDATNTWSLVDTEEVTSPDPWQTYWVKKGTKYVLAGEHGQPANGEWEEGVEYYELVTTNESVETLIDIEASDLQTTKAFNRFHYFYRNQLIHIEIHPGSSGHIDARTKEMLAVVGFYPDPHDTYIQKIHLNHTAYTAQQLLKMALSDEYPKELGEDPYDFPVTTRALVDAYTYLASRLQAKGLLFGVIEKTGVVGGDLTASINNITSEGLYWITMSSTQTMNIPAGFPEGSKNTKGAHLIVLSNKRTSTTITHEEATEIADEAQRETITEADAVTQMFIQLDTTFNVWTRHGKKQTGGNYTWTPWARISFSQYCADLTESRTVTASTVATYLLGGEPALRIGKNDTATAVALPDPTAYPPGTKLQFELAGNGGTTCSFTYTVNGESYTRSFTWKGENRDVDLYKFESDGKLWYLISVYSRITNYIIEDGDGDPE